MSPLAACQLGTVEALFLQKRILFLKFLIKSEITARRLCKPARHTQPFLSEVVKRYKGRAALKKIAEQKCKMNLQNVETTVGVAADRLFLLPSSLLQLSSISKSLTSGINNKPECSKTGIIVWTVHVWNLKL